MPNGTLRYHLCLSVCICGQKNLKFIPKNPQPHKPSSMPNGTLRYHLRYLWTQVELE
ncbi:hypothetical protein H6F73_21805 [Microcoleus sp. FACHB-68]|nr:hypothetical protein [Microcoleus sp. FACHB-68]